MWHRCGWLAAATAAMGLFTGAALPALAQPEGMVLAQDGSGVFGYKKTPVQPWSGFHVHDPDRPLPPRVVPGPAGAPVAPPSDAVVLYDGSSALEAWRDSKWTTADGTIVAGEGPLTSRREFGDCQVHVEWMGPVGFESPWYNQGNSGVELMGQFEIQIFDDLHTPIYPDGMAGAIYGQTPPLVNVCREPGEWQSFDIVFKAPVFENGTLRAPARVTVFQNGVLVQHDEEIHGEIKHAALPAYEQKTSTGPLQFGGHNCPVRFRNVWVRPL